MDWDITLAFFLAAVAYKVPWTAISSLLAQFSQQFGPSILLYLNLAYFVPSIPVLALQSLVQEQAERRWGVPATALARLVFGYCGLALLCACFPAFCSSLPSLLYATAAVGMLYGMCFGTSYQLAARFPATSTVALTTGFVSCGVVVLLLDLMLKRGPFYEAAALGALFCCISVQVLIGLAASALVLRRHWRRLVSDSSSREAKGHAGGRGGIISIPLRQQHGQGMRLGWSGMRQRADSSYSDGSSPRRQTSEGGYDIEAHVGAEDSETQPLLPRQATQTSQHPPSSSSSKGSRRSSSAGGGDLAGSVRVLMRIFPAAFALGLSVGTSMAVFPFFTYVGSSGTLGQWLPQVLFYVRLSGDIAGRVLLSRWHNSSTSSTYSKGRYHSSSGSSNSSSKGSLRALLVLAAVKTALTPVLIAALTRPRLANALGGDVALVMAVGLYWLLSGRINTAAYLLAPSLVAGSQKAQAGSLMALCFQAACLMGLLAAFGLQAGFMDAGVGGAWQHGGLHDVAAGTVSHAAGGLRMDGVLAAATQARLGVLPAAGRVPGLGAAPSWQEPDHSSLSWAE